MIRPKRVVNYGAGKRMGPSIYLHKSALDAVPGLREKIESRGYTEADFDVVKFNDFPTSSGNISLIRCSEFDAVDEPAVESSIILYPDGTERRWKAPQGDKAWIYHHKWLFVLPEYEGFDVEESEQRSRKWLALGGVDKSRIGQRSFWENEVVPRIS
jgi:hypothetical protein